MTPRALRRLGVLAVGLATLIVAPGVRSQTLEVEAPLRIGFVVKTSQETPTGLRMRSLRLGTRDLALALAEQLDQTGSSLRLVIRRPLADLDFAQAHVYLIVDDREFDVTAHVYRPALVDLPFYTPARRARLRADLVEISFSDEGMDALRIASVAGTELTVAGIFRRTARLHVESGADVGYLFSSVKGSVLGGLQDLADPELVAPVRGTVWIGPEKRITP